MKIKEQHFVLWVGRLRIARIGNSEGWGRVRRKDDWLVGAGSFGLLRIEWGLHRVLANHKVFKRGWG